RGRARRYGRRAASGDLGRSVWRVRRKWVRARCRFAGLLPAGRSWWKRSKKKRQQDESECREGLDEGLRGGAEHTLQRITDGVADGGRHVGRVVDFVFPPARRRDR